MTFLCLGYRDEASWDALTDAERSASLEEGLAYDEELRRCGHVVVTERLPDARYAVTVRPIGARVEVIDGPFVRAESRIGSLLILEARDLNHAIHLISRHPCVRRGAVEILATEWLLAGPVMAGQTGRLQHIDPHSTQR